MSSMTPVPTEASNYMKGNSGEIGNTISDHGDHNDVTKTEVNSVCISPRRKNNVGGLFSFFKTSERESDAASRLLPCEHWLFG